MHIVYLHTVDSLLTVDYDKFIRSVTNYVFHLRSRSHLFCTLYTYAC